ncbi:MAG: 5-oxoprolinase subunit PxpB [Alphaproteobacteria bacterium]|nr:5-oxoprolinase subunit PxpB [Alphaproteobacteria bacterium]
MKGQVMADYRVMSAGDTALVVDFGNRIEQRISERVVALGQSLSEQKILGISEIVPTIRSLIIYYEPLVASTGTLQALIDDTMASLPVVESSGRLWQVPVCYDPELAPDLIYVAEACSMPPAEVVELHSSIKYHVYMLGFLPGLAYLGDLPDTLALPRRESPRLKVAAGSVGIGGKMTCIYPMETPCGWHLIGQSPAALWAQNGHADAVLSAGDKVQLQPVSLREFEQLRANGSTPIPILS